MNYFLQMRYMKRILITFLLISTVFMVPFSAKANLQDELNKKKALQDSINKSQEQKKQQQALIDRLNSEVAKLNNSINSTQNTINDIGNNIKKVNEHIVDLNKQIDEQTRLINEEKDKLQQTLNQMYIDSAQYNPNLALVQSRTLSEAVADLQSYQAIELQIEQKAQEIEGLKADLEKKKGESEKEQVSLKSMQDGQIAQKRALDSQKALKQQLSSEAIKSISQLDSTITQYKDQIKAVDGKISEFLAAMKLDAGYKAASGDFVVVNSQSWHYYQTDPRWAGSPLDPTSSDSDSFAESGCLVTSITMVASRFGMGGTPPQVLSKLRAAGAMYGDLVSWGGVSDAFGGKLEFATGGKEPINASRLDASLAAGQPVIVHINQGRFGHWVVVSAKVGDKYAVEDPYFQNGRVYPARWIDMMARLQPS